MNHLRAVEDTPRPRGTTLIGRIAGLPERLAAAAGSWFSLPREESGPKAERSDEDLWLVLAAGDPDGIWYHWHAADRRLRRDDEPDSA